jgi:hypothetical protein
MHQPLTSVPAWTPRPHAHQARGLVHGDDGCVLVQDFHREISGVALSGGNPAGATSICSPPRNPSEAFAHAPFTSTQPSLIQD